MATLLLPYAINSSQELVHIDHAHKGDQYTCPICGAGLSLRISKIPQGAKYHRTNHFSHKRGVNNHCSESLLHKLFKEKVADYIRNQIDKQEDAIWFEWECTQCHELHKGNLIKKAVKVVEELNLQICKPDIALLDKEGNVIIVIEIVVQHKPSAETLKYYSDKNIVCLQLEVDDFADCDKIEEKLSNPNYVNRCPNPTCKKCGHVMNKIKLVTVATTCWKCGKNMKLAMIVAKNRFSRLSPEEFDNREVATAISLGVNIKLRYSRTMHETYLANTCKHCNAFVGSFYMHEYYHLPHQEELDMGYKCFNCIDIKHQMRAEQYRLQDEEVFDW